MLSWSRTARESRAILPRRWEGVGSDWAVAEGMVDIVVDMADGFSQNDVALARIGGECPTL